MIKGFIFDIDDTLTYRKLKKTPLSALKALKKLREKGYKIAVCTAREKSKLKTVPHELMECVDFVAAGNGSCAYKDHKLYYAHLINKDDLSKYIDYIEERNLTYYYSLKNGETYFWGEISDEKIKSILDWFARMPKMRRINKNDDVVSISFEMINDEEYKHIYDINPKIKPVKYTNDCLVCGENVDKVTGVDLFLNEYHFKKDEVIAFGDGEFDDAMILSVDRGVAIKDSKLANKNVAKEVTTRTVIDGAISEYLIENKFIERDKPNIKIFFFDADQTTYDHSIHDVRESTVIALKELRKNGIKTVLCTSRSKEEMSFLPKALLENMDGYISCAGGMSECGTYKTCRVIDKETVKKVIKILEDNDLTYRYVLTSGKGYFNRKDEEKEKLMFNNYRMYPETKPYEGEDIIQILYHSSDKKFNNYLDRKVKNCSIVHLGFSNEVMAKDTDKSIDMLRLAKALNINEDEVGAFGDGVNDADMIRKAKLGIAMGNAKDEAKLVSDYVTGHIEEEGIFNALTKYSYIKYRK